jgi:hypothetical protein
MKRETWFVLIPAARAIEIDVLATTLGFIAHEKPRVDGGLLIVEVEDDLTGVTGELHVHLAQNKHVIVEARELGDRFGRDDLAGLDTRYELSWSRKHAHAVYDTVLTVAAALKRRCGGVVYNQQSGELVELR